MTDILPATGTDWLMPPLMPTHLGRAVSTNLQATTQVIANGVGAHAGFLLSAQNLLANVSAPLVGALTANPGFDLLFTGHR